MKVILDFESRSHIDLKKRGVYVYAADPSTEILCCAIKIDDEPTAIWFPKLLEYNCGLPVVEKDWIIRAIQEAEILGAHNAQFERLMWREILHKRMGFPAQETKRWQCSAARAAALALPRHLDGVGAALNLPIQKDKEGHKLMLRMSKPDKKTGKYVEDTDSLIRLAKYCVQDVEVEYAVEQALPPLPESEERIWQLDQEINDRGVGIDIAGCETLNKRVEFAKKAFNFEVDELTDGKVTTVGQRDKFLDFLGDEGVEMGDMTKGSVTDALVGMPQGVAKRLLEIRQTGSLTSVAKLKAMVALASDDARVRGSLLYYAATTGRFGGKGIQGQNLPRDSYKTEEEVEAVLAGSFDGCAIKAASRCIRGMIVAQDGRHLTAVDFNAIEARVLAWLADEKHILDVFRNNLDPYKVAAMAIYGVGYDEVTTEQRQVGKVGELALGFQGWIGALSKMADAYQIDVGDDERKKSIIIPWRENRPGTENLWHGLEEAALKTVRAGKVHKYGKIMFGVRGIYLFMKLPSGRMLAYPYPEIENRRTPYGQMKEVVTFMGVDTYTRQWTRLSTYGGKLTENAVQAIARDLLCEALLSVDALGIPIVMHVHDEIVVETHTQVLETIEKIMSTPTAWCPDLPLAAEGWTGKRYRK